MSSDYLSGVHGLLLTGGRSSRMGTDKAGQIVAGVSLAELVARELRAAADPVLVVGPHSVLGLRTVSDPRMGPLAALVSGWEQLVAEGNTGPVLVAACDLPFVTSRLLDFLADNLGDADGAFPVAGGRDQVLAACYAPAALRCAARLIGSGELSMRALVARIRVRRIQEAEWRTVAPARALVDVDTPEELAAARRIAELGSHS